MMCLTHLPNRLTKPFFFFPFEALEKLNSFRNTSTMGYSESPAGLIGHTHKRMLSQWANIY